MKNKKKPSDKSNENASEDQAHSNSLSKLNQDDVQMTTDTQSASEESNSDVKKGTEPTDKVDDPSAQSKQDAPVTDEAWVQHDLETPSYHLEPKPDDLFKNEDTIHKSLLLKNEEGKEAESTLPQDDASITSKSAPEPSIQINEPSPPHEPVVVVKQGGQGLSLLALGLVLAFGGAGFYFGHQQILQYQGRMTDLTNQVNSLQNSVQTQTALITEKQIQLNEKQSEINDKQKEIEQEQRQAEKELDATLNTAKQQTALFVEQQENSIQALQKAFTDIKGRRPNDWLLAEAEHLVKQAGRQLWLAKDIDTATLLILAADKRIADLNDPSLTPIREAIAADVQTLKAIQTVDTDGIVLKLMTLQKQIETLPITNAILPPAAIEAEKTVSANMTDWKENLKTSLEQFFNQFVTYRVLEGNATPLLSPDQVFYLQANLKAKLDQAIEGAFRENQVIYQDSLNLASEWVARFYDTDSSATQSVLKTLNELSQLSVVVTFPAQLESQQPISDRLNERLRHALSKNDQGDSLL